MYFHKTKKFERRLYIRHFFLYNQPHERPQQSDNGQAPNDSKSWKPVEPDKSCPY